MGEPAPVTVTMDGYYNFGTGSGSVSAQFRNDSTATITGRVIFVITEDSLYYAAPNGALWHNHVPRDYLPDHTGEVVTIDPADSIAVSRPFSLDPLWDDGHCRILVWLQNDDMLPDSTREIWQAGMLQVAGMGIQEDRSAPVIPAQVRVAPNPCTFGTSFYFTLPQGAPYDIILFDAAGRFIKGMTGVASGRDEIVWQRDDERGVRVRPGVYLYRFISDYLNTSGKIIAQ